MNIVMHFYLDMFSTILYLHFGDAELVKLVDFFGPFLQKAGVETNMIETEWTSLKENIYTE